MKKIITVALSTLVIGIALVLAIIIGKPRPVTVENVGNLVATESASLSTATPSATPKNTQSTSGVSKSTPQTVQQQPGQTVIVNPPPQQQQVIVQPQPTSAPQQTTQPTVQPQPTSAPTPTPVINIPPIQLPGITLPGIKL